MDIIKPLKPNYTDPYYYVSYYKFDFDMDIRNTETRDLTVFGTEKEAKEYLKRRLEELKKSENLYGRDFIEYNVASKMIPEAISSKDKDAKMYKCEIIDSVASKEEQTELSRGQDVIIRRKSDGVEKSQREWADEYKAVPNIKDYEDKTEFKKAYNKAYNKFRYDLRSGKYKELEIIKQKPTNSETTIDIPKGIYKTYTFVIYKADEAVKQSNWKDELADLLNSQELTTDDIVAPDFTDEEKQAWVDNHNKEVQARKQKSDNNTTSSPITQNDKIDDDAADDETNNSSVNDYVFGLPSFNGVDEPTTTKPNQKDNQDQDYDYDYDYEFLRSKDARKSPIPRGMYTSRGDLKHQNKYNEPEYGELEFDPEDPINFGAMDYDYDEDDEENISHYSDKNTNPYY